MYSIFYTGCMVLVWVITLLNGTGIGMAYQTTEYAKILILVLTVLVLMGKTLKDRGLFVPKSYLYWGGLLLVVFTVVPLFYGKGNTGLNYLWAFLVTFLVSLLRPTKHALRLTGFAYGALGLMILWLFQYTEILKGWNANSIAMIGLFSFMVFVIPYYGMRDKTSMLMLPSVGLVYALLIWPTESRSCIFSILFGLLFVFRIIRADKLLSSRKAIVIVLFAQLFVAIFASLLSIFADMEILTAWSLETFNKTLFSGRDMTWRQGFKDFSEYFFFGNGDIITGYWHNSTMTCISAFGYVGFLLWVRFLYLILREGCGYTKDTCVCGSLLAFLVIYCQQSFELGLFAEDPNLIPYVILGILLGRIKLKSFNR